MAILGIDLGYSFTKTSEGVIFPSLVTKNEPPIGTKHRVNFNSETYYVGTGVDTFELNKINDDLTIACMLSAIAQSTNDKNVQIVTGLPVGQYKQQRDQLRDSVMSLPSLFYFNGLPRQLRIDDCIVYMQGVAAVCDSQDDCVVCDIGGKTIDIAYMRVSHGRRELVETIPLYDGMMVLYSKIIESVNAKFTQSFNPDYAEHILLKGLKLKGVPQDTSFLKPIYQDHIHRLTKEIKQRTPGDALKIYLCGGGACLLESAIRKQFDDVELMPNAQFANANGYKKVGMAKWN